MYKADIFIPTSNRVDSLSTCLTSLAKQTNSDFRILLGGREKNSDVEQLLKKYPNLTIHYFIQQKPGLIGAANEALSLAKAPIFIRIDDDIIAEPNWFEEIIHSFKRSRKIGGVTGPTTMTEEGLQSRDLTSYIESFRTSSNLLMKLLYFVYFHIIYEGRLFDISRFLPSGAFTIGSNYPYAKSLKQSLEVGNLEACNWAARTAIVRQVGGFDTLYLKGLGDYHEGDTALKIQRLGYSLIFNPKAALRHNVEQGIVSDARPAAYWRIQNFILFYFRFNRPTHPISLLRFVVYLGMQDAYYCLKFLKTGSLDQLGALPGTVVGLFRAFAVSKYYES